MKNYYISYMSQTENGLTFSGMFLNRKGKIKAEDITEIIKDIENMGYKNVIILNIQKFPI